MVSRRILMLGAVLLSACAFQQRSPGSAVDDHAAHMQDEDRQPAGPVVRTDQGYAGLPASNSTAAARLAASPRHAEWVKIEWRPGSSDSLMAWVVYPVRRDKAPVVVVVHEIFGLTTWVRSVADQVAADGFIAIAPDLVSHARGGPSTVMLADSTAQRLIQSVTFADRNDGIAASANYAMTLPSAHQRYGVIGYCWGGSTVWGHAVNGGVRGFGGGVAFYGSPFATGGTAATATAAAVPARVAVDSLAKIKVPVMLLNGSRDARIGAMMPGIDSAMKALKKDYVGINYDNAIHGFLRAQDDAATGRNADAGQANLLASKDAWPKTIDFLRRRLGR